MMLRWGDLNSVWSGTRYSEVTMSPQRMDGWVDVSKQYDITVVHRLVHPRFVNLHCKWDLNNDSTFLPPNRRVLSACPVGAAMGTRLAVWCGRERQRLWVVSESVSMGIFEVAAIVAETRLGAVAGGWWVVVVLYCPFVYVVIISWQSDHWDTYSLWALHWAVRKWEWSEDWKTGESVGREEIIMVSWL